MLMKTGSLSCRGLSILAGFVALFAASVGATGCGAGQRDGSSSLPSANPVGLTVQKASANAQPDQKGPPRYRSCGLAVGLSVRVPTYAHNASCRVARAVAKGCVARNCFGQFPLPYSGVGEPYLPQAPSFKPLGFECYQAVPPYTAGVSTPRITRHDERPFLCWRNAYLSGPNATVVQQLVAYWL